MKQDSLMPEQGKRTKRGKETQPAADERGAGAKAEEREEGLDERMLAALHAAGEKKALELVALDLRSVASFTDFFLIATGTNPRQVQAIADGVEEQLKKRGTRPARVEGYGTAEWVLLDYGDFIFHVFEDRARRFYDLERLWRDAARVALPPELVSGGGEAAGGSLRKER
jgi:ribosome-associated protein